MPKVTNTRMQQALKLKERLEKGPLFSIGFPFASEVTTGQANEEATKAYQGWAESWILFELIDLIPELKKESLSKRT